MKLNRILIANRGEIACRVMRTAQRMGIHCIATYTPQDAGAMHVRHADQAVPLDAAKGYLDVKGIVALALETGAEAIHPGYGFLSERPDFAKAVEAAGLAFIGPSPESIRAMGLKDAAKALMEKAGVPVVPGYHGKEQSESHLLAMAGEIGYPVLIKARAGGGGKGMRLVDKPGAFADALKGARDEARAAFGDDRVIVEKYVNAPRHIEVQVFGDAHGNLVHLFERDCTMQRRHQKVIEEAPAPHMPDKVRRAMCDAAVRAARAIDYRGAGTVEFIVDGGGGLRDDAFWFMEMNTRLQVEHPVTEAVTGIDLVEWQLRVAAGEALPLNQEQIAIDGHAVEARVYAEDPARDFMPAPGTVRRVAYARGVRIDAGVERGDEVSAHYDPMIAKVVAHDRDRESSFDRLADAIDATHLVGLATNLDFLARLLRHRPVRAARSRSGFDTGLIARDMDALASRRQPPPFALALMCVAHLDRRALRGAAWRLWGGGCVRVHLDVDGERVVRRLAFDRDGTITVTEDHDTGGPETGRKRAGVDNSRAAEVVLTNIEFDRKSVSALVNGKAMRMSRLRAGATISLSGHGARLAATLPDQLRRVASQANPNSVEAPMAGTIQGVEVKPGQKVEKGERLVVMAAMKMEYVLKAPLDGVVRKVHCRRGDAVSDGALLVSFREDDDG